MEDLQFAALTLSFLLASIIFSYYHYSKPQTTSSPPLPPGPRGLPILGYLPFLNPNLHHQFTHLAQKHGPILSLNLGRKLYIIISSPPLIKQIVRDHDPIFSNRDPPVAALVGTRGVDIVWSQNGPYWRDLRKLFVREMLSNANLADSYALRREEVRRAIADLRARAGESVPIGELIFVTELRVVMSLLWGGAILDSEARERLGAEFRDNVSEFVDLLGRPNVSDFFPGLAGFDLQGIAGEMRGVVKKLERILDLFIDEKMKAMEIEGDEKRGEKRKDFLGILLELKEQKKVIGEGSLFGLTELKAILLDIVIGGTDTTATIVEWVMAELLHYPTIMQKVQQEITQVVGANNIVEESHLSNLHYLEAVVKETFRLHPPLPLLVPRCASQSCTIGGYMVPKGSRVFLNMWAINIDPNVWENPLEFRPERFLNNGIGDKLFDYMGNNFQYLPFGSGRRVCPGVPLAEKMVMYMLATLVHSFEWRLPDGEKIDLSEKFGIVMRKSIPLIAIPCLRLPNMELYA